MAGATADSLSPREAAQQIISRYVGQLLHGCGDSRCEEMMCASGRRNGSERPIRGYTARSARTIAITLASGPRPRSRLCPRYQPAGHPTKAGVEPPRDQSSLPQRLSDTNAIRGACGDPDGRYSLEHQERSTKDPQGPQDLERWRTMLENISSRDRSTDLEAEQTFALDVAKALFEGLQWFVGDTAAIKTYASDCARPASSDQYAPSCEVRGVAFQNRLQYEPAQELLHRTLAVVGQLTVSENEFVETLAPLLPRAGYWRPLVACLRHIFLRTWNGDVMLDGVASSAILLLEAIHRRCLETLNKATSTTTARLMNRALLGTSSTAARLDPLTVARSLRLPEAEGTTNLLRLSGPFTTVDKALWLRIFNQIRMSEAHGLAAANKNLHDEYERQVSAPDRRLQHLEEHYLFLNVSRSTALEDAFIQLWQRRKTELLRPLRVRMNEADDDAVGQDLGGVQIEFFNIVCRELFKEELQMFTSLESGYSYFRAGSLQSLYRFELCGVLFGLALHNGICLPVSLPMVFYHALLRDASCTDEGPRAIGDGLDFVFPLEANGLRLSVSHIKNSGDRLILHVVEATQIRHHAAYSSGNVTPAVDIKTMSDAWPGWRLVDATDRPIEITAEYRKHFVRMYLEHITYTFVQPQLKAFDAGFYSVIERSSLKMLSPQNLREILEGSTHLDIDELRRSTEYGHPYTGSKPYIRAFWKLVSSWPEEKQMKLVKFVTAAERIPAAGVGKLNFKIHPARGVQSRDLPSSSTCFGTLNLPYYENSEVMNDKLTQALELGVEGFGVA